MEKQIVTDALVLAWNNIVDRYRAARKELSVAKKTHGKKSAEAKAARKAARAIKKERIAFSAANPAFVAPPKAPKATTGLQRKAEDEGIRAALEKRMGGEVVRTYTPSGGLKAPDGRAVDADLPLTQVAANDTPAPAPVVAEAVAPAAKASLSKVLLDVLAAGFVGTPKQVAERVPAEAWGTTVTAKMAADALGRMAKAGKVTKTSAGTYAAKGV